MMKVYVQGNSIAIVGKAWQIRAKLREYMKTHTYVKDVIKDNHLTLKPSSSAIKHDKNSFTILIKDRNQS